VIGIEARYGARRHEIRVALGVGLRALIFGDGCAQGGLRGGDGGVGEFLFRLERDEIGAHRGDVRERIGKLCLRGGDLRIELLGIDAHERIAALHGLIVANENLGDQAAHFRRDDGAVGAQVRIVGGDLARRAHDVDDARERDDGRDRQGEASLARKLGAQAGGRSRRRLSGVAHFSITSRVEVAVA
jgi:hypothetical protein